MCGLTLCWDRAPLIGFQEGRKGWFCKWNTFHPKAYLHLQLILRSLHVSTLAPFNRLAYGARPNLWLSRGAILRTRKCNRSLPLWTYVSVWGEGESPHLLWGTRPLTVELGMSAKTANLQHVKRLGAAYWRINCWCSVCACHPEWRGHSVALSCQVNLTRW